MSNEDNTSRPGEFELIARLFAPLARNNPGAFALTDDCAAFSPEPGHDLVLTTDTIVAGVHFLESNPPETVAAKALGVNLSDLAAKGAEPKVWLMSIVLPKSIGEKWLMAFCAGLDAMQGRYNIQLAGGDTVSTSGPLTISITAIGQAPKGGMVLRSGASDGDVVYVTGTIGDAWAGLQDFIQPEFSKGLSDDQRDWIRDRYLVPQPRTGLAEALRKYASAAMDISDGLVADFEKLCSASDVAGVIEAEKVPLSTALVSLKDRNADLLLSALAGGDDYEILVCVGQSNCNSFEKAATNAGIPLTRIGSIQSGQGVCVIDAAGEEMKFVTTGYVHRA